MGYHLAGFDVTGVDQRPQPRYPFEFHQGDALEFVTEHGHEFDVIHASPPCQGYSVCRFLPMNAKKVYPLFAVFKCSGFLKKYHGVLSYKIRHPQILRQIF